MNNEIKDNSHLRKQEESYLSAVGNDVSNGVLDDGRDHNYNHELEELFNKIENSKSFKEYFGEMCPDFEPHCYQCKFWNIWNKMKIEVIGL